MSYRNRKFKISGNKWDEKFELSDGSYSISDINQMFHTFLFNIRNYLLKVNNTQRPEVESNIILPRLINFDIK